MLYVDFLKKKEPNLPVYRKRSYDNNYYIRFTSRDERIRMANITQRIQCSFTKVTDGQRNLVSHEPPQKNAEGTDFMHCEGSQENRIY